MVSDESLCAALLGGDLRAFDTLYARHERPLFAFIRRHLADTAEAEDVLHEAFLAILKDRLAASRAASFRAWLFQVARHLCLNRLRTAKRADRAMATEAVAEGGGGVPAVSMPAEALLVERERGAALEDAVARLPSELGALYQLRASGMSYEELAQVLAVPLGTVKSRMHTMIARLREELGR